MSCKTLHGAEAPVLECSRRRIRQQKKVRQQPKRSFGEKKKK